MTKYAFGVDRGQFMPGRKRDDQIAMKRRQRAPRHDQAAVRGARERRDGALDLDASRTLIGLNSTPNEGATVWIAPNWPVPAAIAGSRMTATRVTRGAISLSSSSHLPHMPYSKEVKPVALPPGRARLSTKPAPTGSSTTHEHDRNGAGGLLQRSHDRAAKGQDDVRRERDQFRSVSANAVGIAGAQRVSICTLRPMVQPNSASACRNAPTRA